METKKVLLIGAAVVAFPFLIASQHSPELTTRTAGCGEDGSSRDAEGDRRTCRVSQGLEIHARPPGSLSTKGCGRENMYQCPLFGDNFGWVILDKDYDGQRAICALSGSPQAMEKAVRGLQDGSFMTAKGPALNSNGLPAFYEHCFDVDTGEQSVRGLDKLTFPKMNATAPRKECKDEDDPLKTLACFGVETQYIKRS